MRLRNALNLRGGWAQQLARPELGSIRFTLLVSAVFVALYNTRFFSQLIAATQLPLLREAFFVANNALLLFALTFIVLSLVTLPRIGKPLLIALFWTAAGTAYFMHAYGVVIHMRMIQNIAETDPAEVRDLLSPMLVGYLVVLGLLPTLALLRVRVRFETPRRELVNKLKSIGVALLAAVALLGSMRSDYIAFFRNHKEVRQMANPLNVVYAGIRYAASQKSVTEIQPLGRDAAISAVGKIQQKPTLLVLVIGETARADHFGINGYGRQTTPRLASENIVNFTQVSSCGTETAVSVPCMLSNLGRARYSDAKAKSQESLLDVVSHAGIKTWWRDNNSGCKGACDRIEHESLKHMEVPDLCNGRECFDEALLHGLDAKLAGTTGDMLLVLHQKGSHGPDYHDRYPASMQFYAPVCTSSDLQQCDPQTVVNAYDNTIRYTDHFLGKAIDWLKTRSDHFQTALVYVSDHGESLGENGLYLHGMPYLIAPETQKHVPMIMWLSDAWRQDNAVDAGCLNKAGTQPQSHDNLFHTVLGMLNVESGVYDARLDIVQGCRSQEVLAQRVRAAAQATAQIPPQRQQAVHGCAQNCTASAQNSWRRG
jgi:lipid A ethanolaminephosphotransferase